MSKRIPIAIIIVSLFIFGCRKEDTALDGHAAVTSGGIGSFLIISLQQHRNTTYDRHEYDNQWNINSVLYSNIDRLIYAYATDPLVPIAGREGGLVSINPSSGEVVLLVPHTVIGAYKASMVQIGNEIYLAGGGDLWVYNIDTTKYYKINFPSEMFPVDEKGGLAEWHGDLLFKSDGVLLCMRLDTHSITINKIQPKGNYFILGSDSEYLAIRRLSNKHVRSYSLYKSNDSGCDVVARDIQIDDITATGFMSCKHGSWLIDWYEQPRVTKIINIRTGHITSIQGVAFSKAAIVCPPDGS